DEELDLASVDLARFELVSGTTIVLRASPEGEGEGVRPPVLDFPGGPASGTSETDSTSNDERIALSLASSMPSFPTRATAPLPTVGEVLGEFRLLSVLGRGIQGSVFLAV